METTTRTGRVPVSGPIEDKGRTGKGKIKFKILGKQFFLPENSTYAKMIMGAARAIVVYEDCGDGKYCEVVEVITSFTWQQVLQINAQYSD
jgi:hypothetical protein